MEQFFKRLAQIAYLLAAAVIVLGGVCFCIPQIQLLRGIEDKKMKFLRDIDTCDRQIKAIRLNQERFKTSPEFIEWLAREQQRIAPNEIVFIFE